MSFSQERRIRNNTKDNNIFCQFKTNYKKNNNLNFNKNNNNKVQYPNINEKMDNSNRLNLKDCIDNKFILKSQKIEKPIKIKKENQVNNKMLPILQNDKKINMNSSLTTKRYLIKTQKDFWKIKKMKSMKRSANKSFFSVDKIKLKKKNIKRNIKKDMNINIKPEGQKYIKTLNSKINMKTYINKEKKQEKNSPIYSPSHAGKKRGYSSNSINLNKKRN